MLTPHPRSIAAPSSLEGVLEQGRRAEERGEHQVARELYERALRALAPGASAPTIASLRLGVGRTHLARRNIAAALEAIDAALALPDDPGMDVARAATLELRGRVHLLEGHHDAAERDFTGARDGARRAGAGSLAALTAARLGAVAVVRGNLADAVRFHELAAEEYQAVGDDAARGRCLAQLATLYADLKRWNAAEQAFAEALQLSRSADDDRGLAALEMARAEMALDRANVERARACAERAEEFARRAGDAAALTGAIRLNGVVARELGDLERAGRLLEQGDRQAQAREDLLAIAEVAREKADLYARQDRHSETLAALDRAYRALTQLRARGADVDTARRVRRVEQGFLDVVARWAQRIEGKDQATAGHCERVADLTCEIARRMGVDREALFWYRVGAYLHDIGKLEVPASILNKPGRLTAEEWTIVKRHPAAGAEMLARVDFPWEVRPIVESHHECWDGSGYPQGLAGAAIPLAARIFHVADVYDALVTRRSFKQALGHEETIDVMRHDVGRQFDPAVFRVFEDVVREGVPIPGVVSAAGLAPKSEQRDPPIVDDPLTSVADRASWVQRAARILGARDERPASLLVIDIDHFARVNATYGRLQGDDILWAVAKVLQRALRSGDLIGRRGSDEFVVLLPDTDAEVARTVAERLRDEVARLRSGRRDAHDEAISVSISAGVATTRGTGESSELLLAAADRALHRAKREGRDRVVVADLEEAAAPRSSLDFDAFVAREAEMRDVVALLDTASRGDPRLVTIGGEEGIGKSALVRQLEPEIRLRGGTLVHAQCLRGDEAVPYAVWIDLVARLVELGLISGNGWRALPQLVPGMARPAAGDEWALTPSIVREELVRAVRRAARESLVVLVFEDMQWSDTASWEVLEALAGAVDEERLFILVTGRDDRPGATAEVRRRLDAHPRATRLQLQRFGVDELRRWLQVVFHDADPGDDFPHFLLQYTEGVPLLVVQVLRALAADGGIWYGGTRWEWRPMHELSFPVAASSVLERRLERLTPAARSTLAGAAVLGDDFPFDLLTAALGLSAGEALAAIDEGVAATVLAAPGDAGARRLAFAHPLLADACARTLPERERQRVHEIAARLLELRAPSAVDAIARHYHAAGNDAEGYRYALLAADRAAAVSAHDAAVAAMQVAQRHAPSPRDLAHLRVRLAELVAVAGRYEEAEELCDLALAWLAGGEGDDAGARARARRVREEVRVRRGAAPRRALDALQAFAADAEGEGVGSGARAALLVTAADMGAALADWETGAALARRAMEGTSESEWPGLIAEAMRLLGVCRYASSPAEGFAFLRDAVTRFVVAGDRLGEARARRALGSALLRAGELERAGEILGEALEGARLAHSAPVAALASRSLGELRALEGMVDEARQWLGDADRLFLALHDEPGRVRTQLVRAHVERQAGERDAAHARYAAVADRARTLEVPWLELTALAGAALTNGGPRSESTLLRWQRARELITEARADWWFPGRELVDAVALHMALAAGHDAVAVDLFTRARRSLAAVDPRAEAWLAAECGKGLERAGLRA